MTHKIVVSNELTTEFTNITLLTSLKAAEDYLKSMNAQKADLVYHTSNESNETVWSELQSIYKTYGSNVRFYYINQNPDKSIMLIIEALRGTVMTDTFYLDFEEDLESLLGSTALDITKVNLDTVSDFISAFSRGEERVNSTLYLEQVQNAVTTLSAEIKLKDEKLQTVSSSALDMFKKVGDYVSQMSSLRAELDRQMALLQKSQPVIPVLTNTSTSLTTINYNQKTNIIYLREFRKTMFATSLALLYKKYVQANKRKTCRLIILCSSDSNEFNKLSNMDAVIIRSTNKDNTALYKESDKSSGIYITDCPTNDVFTRLMDADKQVFIVLDKVHQLHPIVKGSFKKLNIYPTLADMQADKGNLKTSVFSVVNVPDALLNLPTLQLGEVANKERSIMTAYQNLKYGNIFGTLDTYFSGVVGS